MPTVEASQGRTAQMEKIVEYRTQKIMESYLFNNAQIKQIYLSLVNKDAHFFIILK